MEQTRITFVINDNTYSLTPGDTGAIRTMPAEDRQQLTQLLEAVRQEEQTALARAREADARAKALLDGTGHTPDGRIQHTPSPERLGSGDADALMARLVMEDQMNRKPGLSKQGLYKIVLGLLAAVCLLAVIF